MGKWKNGKIGKYLIKKCENMEMWKFEDVTMWKFQNC